MKVVVDACVFAAKLLGDQPQSKESADFLLGCVGTGKPLFVPAIVFAEVSAAITRIKGSASLGEVAALRVIRTYNLRIRIIDEQFGLRAAKSAARHGLRGADSIYFTLAREVKGTLVTCDAELLSKSGDLVQCITPSEWLKRYPAPKQ